jgi:hypothetical protein
MASIEQAKPVTFVDANESLNLKGDCVVERTKDTVLVKTTKADYLIILYPDHTSSKDALLIPETASGVFLECKNWSDVDNPFQIFKEDVQYGNLVQRAHDLKIPIYMGDVHLHPSISSKEVSMMVAEATLGAAVVAIAAKSAMNAFKQTSRREAIKHLFKVGGVSALVGAYMSMPLLSHQLRVNIPSDATVALDRATGKIHPDVMKRTLGLRNAVMAVKQSIIADGLIEEAPSKKPLIVSVVGQSHASIEDNFRQSQLDNLRILARFGSGLTNHVLSPETFYYYRKTEASGRTRDTMVTDLKRLWDTASKLDESTD